MSFLLKNVSALLVNISRSNFHGVRHPQVPNGAASKDAGSSNLDPLNLRNWVNDNSFLLASLVIIAIGVLLRLHQYLANRSLWFDEVLLTLNIVNRSFSELGTPLDLGQGAPLGFLWIIKGLTSLFGNNEYTLRLFPLLSGLISLLIFFIVIRKYVSTRAAIFAMAIFSISPSLIYYASEVKQYSSDVLMALIGLIILFPLLEKNLNYFFLIYYGFLGAILIWMSHPIIFVLASVGLIATVTSLLQTEYHRARLVIFTTSWWGMSFLISYYVSLRYLTQHQPLLNYWTNSFAPPLNTPLVLINWIIESFLEIFNYPIGLSLFGLAAFTYLVGAVSLYYKKKLYFFSLLFPLLFALGTAFLHKYPFAHRHLLFLMPSMVILIAEGIDKILSILAASKLQLVGTFFIVLLFYHPFVQASNNLLSPTLKEEIKPVLEYTNKNWQNGDKLYLYYAAQIPFEYYSSIYNFQINDYIVGIAPKKDGDLSEYILDLNQLKTHDRVWLIFSHVRASHGINEEQLFLNYLQVIGGIQRDRFQATGAAVYLYEFR